MAAGPASAEAPSEARIARLESGVAHLVTDVADIKADVRSLRDRVDAGNAKLAERIDAVSIQLNDGLKDSFAKAQLWAALFYIALAGTMFGAMARGFGWI